MLHRVRFDKCQRFIQRVYDRDAQRERQPFSVPVSGLCRRAESGLRCALQDRVRARIAAQLHKFLCQFVAPVWQEDVRDFVLNQHGAERVADRGFGDLGVEKNLDGQRLIGGFIDIDVVDAHAAGDDRNRAVVAAQFVQICAAARDDQVDAIVEFK